MAAAIEIETKKTNNKKGAEAFIRTRLARVQTQLEGLRHQALVRVKAVLTDKRLEKVAAILPKDAFEAVHKRIEQLTKRIDALLVSTATASEAAPANTASTVAE